jgi:hypothetical protein
LIADTDESARLTGPIEPTALSNVKSFEDVPETAPTVACNTATTCNVSPSTHLKAVLDVQEVVAQL